YRVGCRSGEVTSLRPPTSFFSGPVISTRRPALSGANAPLVQPLSRTAKKVPRMEHFPNGRGRSVAQSDAAGFGKKPALRRDAASLECGVSRPAHLEKTPSVGSLLIAPQRSTNAAAGPIQCSERCVR